MCSLTRLYVWVDTAICVSWYSHMCRLIRIYSLKSDAYRVKKRWWQLVRAPRLRSLAFIAREPCREKEGISIKKIPFIALSWHPRFLFYPFELTLSPINIGWAPTTPLWVCALIRCYIFRTQTHSNRIPSSFTLCTKGEKWYLIQSFKV